MTDLGGASIPLTTAVGRIAAGVAAAVLIIGLGCQFRQRTDATFVLAYFTIDSAALASVVLVLTCCGLRSRLLDSLRGTATMAVVVSGIVFAAVIAPASGSGTWIQPHDDPWVRVSTVLLHGPGPTLAVVSFVLLPFPAQRLVRELSWWLVWPLTYLLMMAGLSTAGIAAMPYSFLRPNVVGGLPTAAGITAIAALFLLIGAALIGANRGVLRRSR